MLGEKQLETPYVVDANKMLSLMSEQGLLFNVNISGTYQVVDLSRRLSYRKELTFADV